MQTLTTTERSKNNSSVSSPISNKQPFFAPVKVQPKLSVGAVDDPYEREADAVSEQVTRMPVQQNSTSSPNNNASNFFARIPASNQNVQRECASCDKERIRRSWRKEEEEEKIQKKSQGYGTTGIEATTAVNDVINSGGQLLSAKTRSFFEPRFGHDFSKVKIHTGDKAAKSSDDMNAHAYTLGNNIVFNSQKYSPDTQKGKKLLAHELTHVVQQNAAGNTQNIQRDWDWERAGIGALIGGVVGGVIGGMTGGGGTGSGTGSGCTATATGVSLGVAGSVNAGGAFGLITPITVRGTELADVQDSELVDTSSDHTGSMVSRPSSRSNNSGFMPADNIPDDHHTESISDFLNYYDNHGGDGGFSRLQMDLYKIPKCGINTPQSMPNSGYRIRKEVKLEGTSVVGIVTKTAEAVTIGSNSSTPGLTASRQAKVTLRP
ncbi:MAG: DUF4157 domain-containing protein [Bacteroidales bacterium]|nr:DUF4157 domain-containing protein [Bacteroidales bacterium]